MSAIYTQSTRTCPVCGETHKVREYVQPALIPGRPDRQMFDCQGCGYTMNVEEVDRLNVSGGADGYHSVVAG